MTRTHGGLFARLSPGTGRKTGVGRSPRVGLSARDRRALIVGVVSIASLITTSRGFPIWRTWRLAAQEKGTSSAADLSRALSLLAVSGVIDDSLAARNDRFLALAPALIGGGSPAAGGATLAGIVSGAAATAGVRLGAVEIRPDTAGSETFTRISVHADATGDIAGLTKMLATLESGPTLLAVRSLSINQREPAATSDRMESLRVSIVVEGLMLSPRAEPLEAGSEPGGDALVRSAADSPTTMGSP